MKSKQDIDVLQRLEAALSVDAASKKVFAGFDGYIDNVVHVVDYRTGPDSYVRVDTIDAYGRMISRAAGLSTTVEHDVLYQKLGGNGPIFSTAMAELDQQVTYAGAVGRPPHPVFEPLCSKAEVLPLADSAITNALEFTDGKVIVIANTRAFGDINMDSIRAAVGEEAFAQRLAGSDLWAFLDWTALPRMGEVLAYILEHMGAVFAKDKYVLFDLIDPQTRTQEDLQGVLAQIRRFSERSRGVLSMNIKEARQIGAALGKEYAGEDLHTLAANVAEALPLHTTVVHALKDAVAISGGEYVHVNGAFCPVPKLSTGAGDNFNAGFCYGLLQEWALDVCLSMGTTVSGYYVRHAQSPSLVQLKTFAGQWMRDEIE